MKSTPDGQARAGLRTRVGVLVGLVTLTVSVVAAGGSAQEYGESRGTLAVTHSLEVSGDGFSPSSAVTVELRSSSTDEAVDLGTLTADGTGRLEGSINLPGSLAPGPYALTATGVTPEGATRILSAGVQVPGLDTQPAPVEPAPGIPVWLLALLPVLGLLLVGGAGWWLAAARRRQDEPSSSTEGPPTEAAEHRSRPWPWTRLPGRQGKQVDR
jgi:hypothetical protein